MARVTVEDCIERIPNRFDLVLRASERARKLDRADAQSPLDIENDKNTVVALREIAEGIFMEEFERADLQGEEDDAKVKASKEEETSTAVTDVEGEAAEAGEASENNAPAEEDS